MLDLTVEIKKRAKRKERTLVTTLTKKTAEDLAKYLEEHSDGLSVMYLHSDIETLKRQDILEELNLSLSPVNSPHQSSLLFETADEEKIYRMLEDNGASSFNSLLNQTNLSLHNAQVTLTTLELRGLIEQKFGEYMIA